MVVDLDTDNPFGSDPDATDPSSWVGIMLFLGMILVAFKVMDSVTDSVIGTLRSTFGGSDMVSDDVIDDARDTVQGGGL